MEAYASIYAMRYLGVGCAWFQEQVFLKSKTCLWYEAKDYIQTGNYWCQRSNSKHKTYNYNPSAPVIPLDVSIRHIHFLLWITFTINLHHWQSSMNYHFTLHYSGSSCIYSLPVFGSALLKNYQNVSLILSYNSIFTYACI